MTHCKDCHQEVKGMASHISKCVPSKDCSLCFNPLSELNDEISRQLAEKGSLDSLGDLFGDTFRSRGYVEDYLNNPKQTKIIGCKIPYRAQLKDNVVDSVANVKRTLFTTLELISKHPFSVLLQIPFYKSWFIDGIEWLVRIYEADLEKKVYKNLVDFAPVTQELLRVGLLEANRIPIGEHVHEDCKDGKNSLEDLCPYLWRNKIIRLFWCLISFIQFDSAYYYRVHDFFYNLNLEFFKQNPRKELNRLFDIAIQREHQIPHKIKLIKKVVNLIMLTPAKKHIIRYFKNLDTSKFIPDYIDYYWYGRRQGYDFGGISVNIRSQFSENLDKQLKNVIIKC